MVFQDYALYPHMTVLDNIAYPLKVKRVAKAERHRSAEEAGASLALEGTMGRRPGQLSGGQQQRVALARAIAYRPKVFLFDEPLSNLDARLRLEARTFLKRLQKDLGITTVYVTHDQSEALALADRMAVMEAGRIRQLGTPVGVFRRRRRPGCAAGEPGQRLPGDRRGRGRPAAGHRPRRPRAGRRRAGVGGARPRARAGPPQGGRRAGGAGGAHGRSAASTRSWSSPFVVTTPKAQRRRSRGSWSASWAGSP
jgi:multiple sugar transport system ATP-binding protein